MTGLFQIFDRYRALTRSKSIPKKVTAGSHGKCCAFDPYILILHLYNLWVVFTLFH